MILDHLDNNFFPLTGAQARELVMEHEMPKPGWERRADPERLQSVQLRWSPGKITGAESIQEAWVTRTTVCWRSGTRDPHGVWDPHQVWALHVLFKPFF